MSYAKYELQIEQDDSVDNARSIFEKAAKFYKERLNSTSSENDEYQEFVGQRIALLKAWEEFEVHFVFSPLTF